jgi:hypothetical protein
MVFLPPPFPVEYQAPHFLNSESSKTPLKYLHLPMVY